MEKSKSVKIISATKLFLRAVEEMQPVSPFMGSIYGNPDEVILDFEGVGTEKVKIKYKNNKVIPVEGISKSIYEGLEKPYTKAIKSYLGKLSATGVKIHSITFMREEEGPTELDDTPIGDEVKINIYGLRQ